jgi:hypothetical protein
MTTKTPLFATLAVLALASCATRDPMPFAEATNCFYPACVINVAVVDEGGVRKLRMTNDGNVRMGTRHRLTAIVWNLQTPGYEFRGNSIRPAAITAPAGGLSPAGLWGSQIIDHNWSFYSVSVTDLNTERAVMAYDITVYPDGIVRGDPVTATRGIVNDPGPHPQRQQ